MRIGIMGPADSIEKIMAMEKDFESDVELIPLEALTLEDSARLMESCQEKVDGLLFTGCAVYDSALRAGDIEVPHRYVRHNDASLLNLLLKPEFQTYRRPSIDILEEQVALDLAGEEHFEALRVLPYQPGFSEKDYIAFHDTNIASGTCDVVLTGFTPICDYYRERGIPVFRLYTTRFEIRNTMSHLVSDIKNEAIDGAKISVQILRLLIPLESRRTTFDALEKMLDFEKELLPYLKAIQGTIFNDGADGYVIFTTKGAMQSDGARRVYREIMNRTKMPVASGVGIGVSAAQAELNATIALSHALDEGGSVLFLCDEEGRLEGPVNGLAPQIERPSLDDAGIEEAAKKTGLSHNYLKKISGLMALYERNRFTAQELGHYLGISDRSARRLVKKLMDGGYATVVSKRETPGAGRPQNVVEIADF